MKMVTRKTLRKQGEFSTKVLNVRLKQEAGFKHANPLKHLHDEDFVMCAVWDSMSNNDPEGVLEILLAYIEAQNWHQKKSPQISDHALAQLPNHSLRKANAVPANRQSKKCNSKVAYAK